MAEKYLNCQLLYFVLMSIGEKEDTLNLGLNAVVGWSAEYSVVDNLSGSQVKHGYVCVNVTFSFTPGNRCSGFVPNSN